MTTMARTQCLRTVEVMTAATTIYATLMVRKSDYNGLYSVTWSVQRYKWASTVGSMVMLENRVEKGLVNNFCGLDQGAVLCV